MKDLKESVESLHRIPADLKQQLTKSKNVQVIWMDLTPLARNEYICWVISAKLDGTRQRRILRTIEQLQAGKRRPCCWAGCPHSQKNKGDK